MEERIALKKKYVNIIVCLLAFMFIPLYLYGLRVLTLLITGLVTGVITDWICLWIFRKQHHERYDYSAVITSMIIVLLMPATVPPWIIIISVVLALVVAKHPFGGEGKNMFNPAAVGVAFSAICWPEYVLRYPLPFSTRGVVDEALIQYGVSPASVLRVGGTPKIDYFDAMLGKFAGPMGATCMIVLAACLLFLVLRKCVSLRVVLSTLFVVGLCAIIFPRVITGRWSSLIFEGCSGALIFGLVFMTSDPTTLPKTNSGQILYGLILGAIVVIFRHFGAVELEFVYAILIANIFAIPCDNYARLMSDKLKKIFQFKKQKRKLALEITDLRGESNA